MKISAVVNTRNEERNIGFCLKTLLWCDEIVVVDMESEDRTVEIARRYTDRIFHHPKVLAFDIAKKFAVEQASGDWILLLDADEMVSPSLAATLSRCSTEVSVDVVEISFRHYIMGACVEHSGWGFTPLPRFFRKGKMEFLDTVHDYMRYDPSVSVLRLVADEENCIIHFNYVDSSHFVEKLNRYTSIEAQHLFSAKVPFSCATLLNASARQFLWRFIKCKGYRDGLRGFFLCLMMAFYQALIFIKLWEKYQFKDELIVDRYDRIRERILKEWGRAGL